MSEQMSEKEIEIELLKEELKMYKINLAKVSVANRFAKIRKTCIRENVEEQKLE